MEFSQEFERDFMRRTLELVRGYTGAYDATNLLNCLLGLLIVPKESSLDRIPDDPVDALMKWGISPESIKGFGQCQCRRENPKTLRQLVKSLRNSVAHFRFEPRHRDRRCIGFEFRDKSGFHAVIGNDEMTVFVERLAQHLEKQWPG